MDNVKGGIPHLLTIPDGRDDVVAMRRYRLHTDPYPPPPQLPDRNPSMGILRRGEYVRQPRMNGMEFQPPPIVCEVQCEQSLRVRDIAAQTDVSIDQDGHSWVRVMLLSDFAVQPVKRDRGAREILLFSPHYCYIRPGSGVGVKTDVALELACGVYGQVVSCPDAQLGAQAKLEGS